ncbi:DUF6397 family protein [Streptomyces tsukubensis]|uniref:DUF6397 family protein n=1 Tax=Streptomyces tsukubensis TaxID=83656 RepID=UPI00117FBAA3|nr:DUF6397 family protein [Streptomyces tsukubensis]QFR96961.1 hypothetical protein GBW32_32840 [Streptomyces tsukubensis]
MPSRAGPAQAEWFSRDRAARELRLRSGELDMAVRLGLVAVAERPDGGRGVPGAQIERLRAEEGFPEDLRERVRTVGTAEGAAILGITTERFGRLARLGLLTPVRFNLNRYRAVVWRYLAEDVRRLPYTHHELLTGRAPEPMRARLASGLDLRARRWREWWVEFPLRWTEDPWEAAAALASLLSPEQVSLLVPDSRERDHLCRMRPAPFVHGVPGSLAAHVAEAVMIADSSEEIVRLGSLLDAELRTARRTRAAPGRRPGPETRPASLDEQSVAGESVSNRDEQSVSCTSHGEAGGGVSVPDTRSPTEVSGRQFTPVALDAHEHRPTGPGQTRGSDVARCRTARTSAPGRGRRLAVWLRRVRPGGRERT